MAEFGENGRVIGDIQYEFSEPPIEIKRVGLAIFLCGIFAALLITIFGVLLMGVFEGVQGSRNDEFLAGLLIASVMMAFNLFLFFISIPLAWIGLAIAIGGKPKQQIIERGAYVRAGAKAGAVCICLVTGLVSLSVGAIAPVLGVLTVSAPVGGLAGAACGWLFFTIVRPDEQIKTIDVSVF